MKLRESVRLHCQRLQAALDAVRIESLRAAADALERARREGRAVFILGNGGSAATAAHFATDLGACASNGSGRFRALSLTVDATRLTGLSNDGGFERVFVRQLESLARPGDVVVCISGSGNSPNILAAMRHARRAGLASIGLLGSDGGSILPLVDHPLLLPARYYGVVEDGHSALCHILVGHLGGGPQAIPRTPAASSPCTAEADPAGLPARDRAFSDR